MDIQTRVTAAEFLALPETNLPMELINGEIVRMASPEVEHQRASKNTFKLIDRLIPNGEVFYAPLDVYFDEINVVQPDVMWVSAQNTSCAVLGKHLRGAPDLIVEVLSPGTWKQDRKKKFRLYEKHGVREYWMIHPIEKYVEVWQWQDGKFMLLDVYGTDETFTSPLLGMVDVKALFPE